jgi:TPR repeat protein
MFFEKKVKQIIQSFERKNSDSSIVKGSGFTSRWSTRSTRTSNSDATEKRYSSSTKSSSPSTTPTKTKSVSSQKPYSKQLSTFEFKDESLAIAHPQSIRVTDSASTVPRMLNKSPYVSEFTLVKQYDGPIQQQNQTRPPMIPHHQYDYKSHQNPEEEDGPNHSANYSIISDLTDTASWTSSKKSFHDNELPPVQPKTYSKPSSNVSVSTGSFSTQQNTEELCILREFLCAICLNPSFAEYYTAILLRNNILSLEELKRVCKNDECHLLNLGFDYIIARDICDALLTAVTVTSGESPTSKVSKTSRNTRNTRNSYSPSKATASPSYKSSSCSIAKENKELTASDIAKCYYKIISSNSKEAYRQMKLYADELNNFLAKGYLMRVYALGQGGNDIDTFLSQRIANEILPWLKTTALDSSNSYNVYCKYLMGVCFNEGLSVSKNQKEAFLWYKQSAELGYDAAQAVVGHCFYTGSGILKDLIEASRWYRLAANQGFAAAQCNLGICYELGEGLKKDLTEAVRWYRLAADQGNYTAQYNLALALECGTGIKHNYTEALKYYKSAAEQGHAAAQYKLGTYYFTESEHLELLEEEAFYWLEKSMNQGNIPSHCQLGLCYERGIGIDQSMEKAIIYYRLGSEKGDAAALYHLAHCYYTGNGIERNERIAVDYYLKSAEKGYAAAQNNLGFCYFGGTGTSQDYNRAFRYYKMSAENGYSQGQFNLGYCYEQGIGTVIRTDEMIKWYRLAAEQGHTKAETALKRLKAF